MSTLWLTVEVSPGADIKDACRDAVVLAGRTGLTIWFDFNGVKCLAHADDDPSRIAAAWEISMKSTPRQIAGDRTGGVA